MKKTMLITLFLVFTTTIFSQSISDLDTKNGFRDFKIGDTYQKWMQKVEFKTYLNGDKQRRQYLVKEEYTYTDIFGYPIKGILLTFNNDRLIMIDIFLKEIVPEGTTMIFNSDDYIGIKANFVKMFGKPTSEGTDQRDGNLNTNCIWEGNKIFLWVKYVFKGTLNGGHFIKITVIDLSDIKKERDNDF